MPWPCWVLPAVRRQSTRVRCRVVLGALIISCACLFVVNNQPLIVWKEANMYRDSWMLLQWEGFGPEIGMYNFTVVTALVDIGRDKWNLQSRGFNEYLLYMQRVLKLDVNMIIYVDPKGAPMVQWMRRGREHRTQIIDTKIDDLPYRKYRSQIQRIMDSEEYQRDNVLYRKKLCEATIPEYDILQWSKMFFLHEAIRKNPFHNDYFIWLDAGYGRGEAIHPEDGVWRPTKLFRHADKVTFLEREDVEKYRDKAHRLHKMSINIVAGGFVGGGSAALERLYELQQKQLEHWMQINVVDDDQTMWMQIYYKHPEIFHLVRADWYDAFWVFSEG